MLEDTKNNSIGHIGNMKGVAAVAAVRENTTGYLPNISSKWSALSKVQGWLFFAGI